MTSLRTDFTVGMPVRTCRAALLTTRVPSSPSPFSSTRLSVDTYQAAYQALTGADVLPGRAAYRRQIVVGRLANLGILNGQRGASTLTEAAKDSFIT